MPSTTRIGALVVVLSAHAAALGLLGWYGQPWEARTGMALAVFGALAGGIIEGATWRIQLRAAAAYCVFSVTFLVAMVGYVHVRSSYRTYELFLPLFAAVIPFLAVREILRVIVIRNGGTSAREPGRAAVVAATLIGFTVASAWHLFRPMLENAGDTGSRETSYAWVISMTEDGSLSYQGSPLSRSEFPPLCRRVMSLHPENPHELRVHCPHGGARLAAQTLEPLLRSCGPRTPGLTFLEAN
jgi:hypothetical protein